ncbi:glycosyltransferase family 4 protein [Amycolatopsis anabasis]|uniref:glycosyltransferase family 4 protein n=1 Tax=Amycolatopsis anabasis TaxID=1840409 RepID=UPI00131A892A|nr:glycosyltransferase family 4 protein [Amycolatopsis anabasis]
MRSAMWTPLPPQRSGIADYSFELLEALSGRTEITAVNDRAGTALTPAGGRVADPDAVFGDDTLHLYHMGNHASAHAWIYRRALAVPGVVVLHDTSLLDFYSGYFGSRSAPEFREEVRFAHGPVWGDPHDPGLIEGWPAIEVDGVPTLDRATLTMERRLVTASRAVLVHDPHSADFLRARYPGTPVHTVPSGAPIRDDADRAAIRARLGWDDENVVFGVFGSLARIKRVTVAVLAFAEVRRRWPQARLVIAGHGEADDVLAEIRRTITGTGADGSVHIALSPDKREFEDLITATDAVINLRWPTAGETSAVMMRAFAAGRPVITSDLPQHRHYDRAFCWPVSTDPAQEAEQLYGLLERAVSWPEDLRAAGRQAREYAREHLAWPVAADAYLEVLESARDTPPAPARAEPRWGVNVFADARATTGLSESARRHIHALAATGVEMTYTEFNTRAPNRSLPLSETLTGLRRGKEFPVDLWLVNVNEFQLIREDSLDRYTIALWAWELPAMPEHALVQLPRIDELWVLSSYVAEACRTATDMPITVIPSVVPQDREIAGDRARFGFAEDGLIVLFTFSASSSDARKNPWAVIEAFRRAFRPEEWGTTAHLVIKANDLHRFPELSAHLASAVAGVHGTLLEEEMSREDMDCLLATCDVYMSLHRSEGFGLGMAEAMAMGKPVIATGYGGNVDFMPPGAAAVVGYKIRPIVEQDHRLALAAGFGDWYSPGQLWAEPDVPLAARWLRWLAGSERRRRELGARGAAAVRAVSSPEAVGAVMARRLDQLKHLPLKEARG